MRDRNIGDIFLPYIFLFEVLPTGKCGTGKYLPSSFFKQG